MSVVLCARLFSASLSVKKLVFEKRSDRWDCCGCCYGTAVASCVWPVAAQTMATLEEIQTCNENLLQLKSMAACGGPEMQHCRRNTGVCADDCQDTIDLVYRTCGGLLMTLYNHETDWVSTEAEEHVGETVDWDEEVAPAVKRAVESCGCDGAAQAVPAVVGLALVLAAVNLPRWR